MYTFMNNPLNQLITAQEVDFLIISSLFSFLYLSNSFTGEVAKEKSWKNRTHNVTAQSVHYSSINGFPDY